MLPEALAEGIRRLPGVVVWDLARNVVCNMGFRDTVSGHRTEPGHDTAKVAEEAPVKRSKGTARERELGSTVVGQNGVGVLEEGDEDKPVVYPVRSQLEL